MKKLKLTKDNHDSVIVAAIAVLKQGGIIIYPTETCYGVGVDATNPKAVEKLLKYKQRPTGKPISIAVVDRAMAAGYVTINETAENLYKNFLPGPITVISEVIKSNKQRIVSGVVAEDGSLGVRIPDYPFTLELIKQFGKPITATSANLSGRKTPYSIKDILDNASEKNKKLIGLLIDAGTLPKNPPSTVVDTRLNDENVLRDGTWNKTRSASKKGKGSETHHSSSTAHTQKVGEETMRHYLPRLSETCVIFALQGDLGVGKTQFAKGVARALGIKEAITSPTYSIVKEYKFKTSDIRHQRSDNRHQTEDAKKASDIHLESEVLNLESVLYHIDTWRMQEDAELSDLGFNHMVKRGNVVVIEWADKIGSLLNEIDKPHVLVRVDMDDA